MEQQEIKKNYLFGMHPVFEAISAGKNIEKVMLKKGLEGEQFYNLISLLQEKNIPFQFVPVERLDRVTKARHQGVIAIIASVDYVSLEEGVEYSLSKKDKAPLILLLDGVSDVRNFGAIARTAECAGVDCIILPAKGGASITPDSIKTSAGALLRMNVCKVPNLKTAVYYLLQSDFQLITCTEKAEGYIYDIDFTKPTAIVMGAEDKGISDAVRNLATAEAKIPMAGKIGSLNVSNAAAVIMYEVVRQRLK
ncbi:MAG: 23S rRNA (guanosine(2251)-2'-O)-methyltransferase RlmB [Bacteroidales bacterium]|nr:23S rRNA (guanosine(2251)-2'-O)-methyltransferase RlmB [Bacteroidales bacterium]